MRDPRPRADRGRDRPLLSPQRPPVHLARAVPRGAYLLPGARQQRSGKRARPKAKAEAVFAEVDADPDRFEELARPIPPARRRSRAARSGLVAERRHQPRTRARDGDDGRGLASWLVRSRHGYHVLRLDDRAPATELPLDQAKGWIAEHLKKTSKRRAIAQYLQLLTARAKIDGIDLAAADSPLVQ